MMAHGVMETETLKKQRSFSRDWQTLSGMVSELWQKREILNL